jgi:NAD(P)-dependent dehydrogenase (short-subunit alcohol dehydrogenase family)
MSTPLIGRVAVVTGGGGGIGSACSLELARQGATVVVMDPGVGVQGEDLKEPSAADTARRIRAEGGTAIDSMVSVTDLAAVESLFQEVRRDLGSLDIVVNTAGILRFPDFVATTEDDWTAVVDVHYNGYLHVLSAALPLMIEAGYGRIVAFTSGVGLARTSGGAVSYGCAKRAVAALTWELGPLLPRGVNVNALSPIAGTRMVRQTLLAAGASPGGVDLSAMPGAEDMAPAAACLSGDLLESFRGQVVFSAGSELTLIRPPRLLEAARTEGVADFGTALATLVPVVFGPGEGSQRSGGGSNPRLGDVFSLAGPPPSEYPSGDATCLVVSDDPLIARAVESAAGFWGAKTVGLGAASPAGGAAGALPVGFEEVDHALTTTVAAAGPIDAIIVINRNEGATDDPLGPGWQQVLETHRGNADRLLQQAAWARAAARHAADAGRPLRVIHVSGATTAAGRTTAQAVTQLSRSVNEMASAGPIDTFAVSLETTDSRDFGALGQFVARLARSDDGLSLKGAELVFANGWMGLRSHPGSAATVTFGGPEIPQTAVDALKHAL